MAIQEKDIGKIHAILDCKTAKIPLSVNDIIEVSYSKIKG